MSAQLQLLLQQGIYMHIIKSKHYHGFAIVEVLLATVVLAIGFIELTRAFSSISSVAVRAVAMTRASNLNHAIMERVMSQDFDAKGIEAGGYALDFDGSNDYVDVGDFSLGGSLTFEAWMQYDSRGTWSRVFDFGENGASDDNIWLGLEGSSGKISFEILAVLNLIG